MRAQLALHKKQGFYPRSEINHFSDHCNMANCFRFRFAPCEKQNLRSYYNGHNSCYKRCNIKVLIQKIV